MCSPSHLTTAEAKKAHFISPDLLEQPIMAYNFDHSTFTNSNTIVIMNYHIGFLRNKKSNATDFPLLLSIYVHLHTS